MTPNQWRERAQWARKYLEAHPEASVDEIARQAEKEGVAMPKEVITATRRDFRLARTYGLPKSAAAQSIVVVDIDDVMPLCDRCGQEGHWISQCEVVIEPAPAVIEQEYVPTAVPAEHEQPVDLKVPPLETPVEPTAPPTDKDVGRTRSIEGTFIRRRRLNEIVEAQPEIHPMEAIVQLRQEFGIGLDFNYTYETVRISRELHGLPPLRSREDTSEREFGEREKVTTVPATEQEEAPLTVDEELEWMATRISEIVRAHSLSEVNIRTENGSLVWDYEIRVRKSGKKAL